MGASAQSPMTRAAAITASKSTVALLSISVSSVVDVADGGRCRRRGVEVDGVADEALEAASIGAIADVVGGREGAAPSIAKSSAPLTLA